MKCYKISPFIERPKKNQSLKLAQKKPFTAVNGFI